MDQLKTVRGQELTHPLQYSREQTDTIQKEKVMHSKFKGTAGVTGESVKSEEIQVSCKINTLFSSMNVLVFRYHMDLSPFICHQYCLLKMAVCTVKISVFKKHHFDLCFKCTTCSLYIRKKIRLKKCAFCFEQKHERPPCSLYLFVLAFPYLS